MKPSAFKKCTNWNETNMEGLCSKNFQIIRKDRFPLNTLFLKTKLNIRVNFWRIKLCWVMG